MDNTKVNIINGAVVGVHLGAPMQDATPDKPEDNEAYATERNTETRLPNSNTEENLEKQPEPTGGGSGPIDPKRLPEGYPYKEQSAIEWDGNTDGLVNFNSGPTVLHKVSDKVLTSADLIGTKIFFSGTDVENGEFFEHVIVDNTMVREEDGAVLIAIEIPNSNIELFALASLPVALSENMPAGTYFGMLSDDDNLVYASKVSTETIHTMAPEFLPAGVGSTPPVTFFKNPGNGEYSCNYSYDDLLSMMSGGKLQSVYLVDPAGGKVINLTEIDMANSNEYLAISFGDTILYYGANGRVDNTLGST